MDRNEVGERAEEGVWVKGGGEFMEVEMRRVKERGGKVK